MSRIDVPITLPRFEALLAAYGARLERWPDGERDAVHALLETSEEARALALEQRTMDVLFLVHAPKLSPGLLQRLDAIPEQGHVSLFARRLNVRGMWAPVLGWAAVAAFGLWLGARSAGETATGHAAADSLELDEVAPYDESEQLAVFGSTLARSELP
jgi:hypothetical protein